MEDLDFEALRMDLKIYLVLKWQLFLEQLDLWT